MATTSTGAQQVTEVARCLNWQHRVHNEILCQRGWEQQWGFLKQGDGKGTSTSDSLDSFISTQSSQGSLASPKSYIAAYQKGGGQTLEKQDSLERFMGSMTRTSRKLPQQEFEHPLTTSQQIGWGKNLEVFGRMSLAMR